MVRRTVSLPESVDELVRELAEDGESFSAAVARLIRTGARALREGQKLSYIGSATGGPEDLGLKAEEYLKEIFETLEERERLPE